MYPGDAVNEDLHGHELALGLVAVDSQLPGEGVGVDVGLFLMHICESIEY